MPRGGPRPGFGGKQPGAGRPRKMPPVLDGEPRPVFENGREFALWALNAPDDVIGADQKVRIALGLIAAEAKPSSAKPEPKPADDGAPDVYATRATRPFGVVNGDRR